MSPTPIRAHAFEIRTFVTSLGSSNFLRLFRPFPPLASPIPPRSPPASVRQTHNACCGRLKSGHSSLAMPCHMLQRHNIPIAPTYCGRLNFGRRNLPAAPAVRAAGARSRPKALAPAARTAGPRGQLRTSFRRPPRQCDDKVTRRHCSRLELSSSPL